MSMNMWLCINIENYEPQTLLLSGTWTLGSVKHECIYLLDRTVGLNLTEKRRFAVLLGAYSMTER